MISIELWRTRIGGFCGGHFRPSLKQVTDCVPCAGVSDVLLLYFSLWFLVTVGFCLGRTVVTAVFEPFSTQELVARVLGTFVTPNLTVESVWNVTVPVPPWQYVSVDFQKGILVALNCVLAAWRIWLSNDVEKNPGPPKQDLEKVVNDAVSKVDSLEHKLTDKIASLGQSLDQKLDKLIQAVQSQADMISNIEKSQQDVKAELSSFREDINLIKDSVASNREAINTVSEQQDRTSEVLEEIQDDLDRLEGFSRRNNVKIFGLKESRNEVCEKLVMDVLNHYLPREQWSRDTVERAHRLGTFNPSKPQPRPVIVKFQRWGEAMALMKAKVARENMKADGIGVAQDLTKRQAAKLRDLKAQGKVGYYRKGRLHIKDHPDSSPDRRQSPSAENVNKDSPRRDSQNTATPSDVTATETTKQPIVSSEKMPSGDASAASAARDGQQPVATESGSGSDRGARHRTRSTVSAHDKQTSLRDVWGAKSTRNDNVSK